MSDDVLREDRDGVAIVTLNRPKKLNAISLAMRDVIFRAVDALRDRACCAAGADATRLPRTRAGERTSSCCERTRYAFAASR